MYFNLAGVLRQRLLLELRDSFSAHPEYRKIVPYIQDKYVFKSRPEFGMVVKGMSGNKVQLSPSNFVGSVVSHVMLAYVGQPVYPIEWVREDAERVRRNGMETAPGVYYITILSAPTATECGYFAVDPLLTQNGESVLWFQLGTETTAQLQNVPLQNTLRLYINERIFLVEGRDYSVDYTTGAIQLTARFLPNDRLTADYRRAGQPLGPIPFFWNRADWTTLPGVVLAFGKRAEKDQKVAVVVYENRVVTAEAYGGKFEANFDVDVISADSTQCQEIADLTFMFLWAEKKARLELEGIEVVDVSHGGESEEQKDEQADLFSHSISMSIQLRADWEVHTPLPLTFSRMSTSADLQDPEAPSRIKMIQNNLFFATAPILMGRSNDFERIS